MLIEWDAHTDYYNSDISIGIDKTFGIDTRTQANHVNFDRDSEGLEYWEYYKKACMGYIERYFGKR